MQKTGSKQGDKQINKPGQKEKTPGHLGEQPSPQLGTKDNAQKRIIFRNLDGQANLLTDANIPVVQRQAMASRIGKLQGNRHLLRIMAEVKRCGQKKASRQSESDATISRKEEQKRKTKYEIVRGTEEHVPAIIWRDEQGKLVNILHFESNKYLDLFLNNHNILEQLIAQGKALWRSELPNVIKKQLILDVSDAESKQPAEYKPSAEAESYKEELDILLKAGNLPEITKVLEEAQKRDLPPRDWEMLKNHVTSRLKKLVDKELDAALKGEDMGKMLRSLEPAMRMDMDDDYILQRMELISKRVEQISERKVTEAIEAGDLKGMFQGLEPSLMVGADEEFVEKTMARITKAGEKIIQRNLDAAIQAGDQKGMLVELGSAQLLGVKEEVQNKFKERVSKAITEIVKKDLKTAKETGDVKLLMQVIGTLQTGLVPEEEAAQLRALADSILQKLGIPEMIQYY